MLQDADALPQLIGDYKPLDQWQAHLNELFYKLRGDQLRTYYQTFASADFRLAHALAADYYEQVTKREKARKNQSSSSHTGALTVLELGPGNGNLAACFLSHLKALDRQGAVYPRVRYVLVDWEQPVLDRALAHPELAAHRDRLETHCASVEQLTGLPDGSVDYMICNELWNDLPTKLLAKHGGEVEDVISALRFEELLKTSLEKGEPVRRPSDSKPVNDVVFIQCSGSRDPAA